MNLPGNADAGHSTTKRGTSGAERHAAGVAGGAAVGMLLGLFLGIRLNSGATRIERRLLDFREAWDIIRH